MKGRTHIMMNRSSCGSMPVQIWRGLVERGLAQAVMSPSRPVRNDEEWWQHPLPQDKWLRLQQVRRAHLGSVGRIARQHCWW